MMTVFTAWIILSIPIIIFSRRSLLFPRSHGFYRFLAWECILWLIIVNIGRWFTDPFSFTQVISWILLISSVIFLIPAVNIFKKTAKQAENRPDSTLYTFEKTGELIQNGIYKYVRHPMYSSLLFVTWGACMKNPEENTIVVSIISTVFLYITAKIEEKENINYFGRKYEEYVNRTKMFVPFIF